jgi:[citrate (pro-3S)-lyase] ligase
MKSCILFEELWKDFFDEIYSYEYAKEIAKIDFASTRMKGIVKLNDAETKFYNVKNGERKTIGQPPKYDKSIYFFGPCLIVGAYVEDAHTIESYLQGILNSKEYNIRVVNYGSWQDELALLQKICKTEYKKGDVVIVYDDNKCFDGVPNLNLANCLEREKVSGKWMLNSAQHCNYKINELYAKEIYNFIKDELEEEKKYENAEKVMIPNYKLVEGYLKKYFTNYSPVGTVGSIVMNCNPFTLGHRYLIEQALKMVDNLIIFVVEEDKSLFTFRERYAMVCEGTRDLDNVTVVPSGNFILSQTTFPEYFIKIEDNDLENNVEYDILLFAEAIAPKLNITYRFVGEEKADKVTNRYNLAMKDILPKHGVKIVEIPRKTIDNDTGKVISASLVRERLEHYPFGNLSDLLPESTRKLLV